MKKDESAPATAIAIIFLLVMIVPSVMWKGYALSLMWGWFISPTFGLPLLRVPIALGISAIFSFMTPNISCKKEDEGDDTTAETVLKSLIKSFVEPAIFLLFGWIVKSWM